MVYTRLYYMLYYAILYETVLYYAIPVERPFHPTIHTYD